MDRIEIIQQKFIDNGIAAEISERTSESLNIDNTISKSKHRTLIVSIPIQKKNKTLFISETDDLDKIEEFKIEKFSFLEDYQGIWSSDFSFIECQLLEKESSFFEDDYNYLDSFLDSKQGFPYINDGKPNKKNIEFSLPKNKGKVFLGDCSDQFNIVENLQRKSSNKPYRRIFTIRIEGISIHSHDEAITLLTKISNSIFFQFDLLTHIPLQLAPDKKYINTADSEYLPFF